MAQPNHRRLAEFRQSTVATSPIREYRFRAPREETRSLFRLEPPRASRTAFFLLGLLLAPHALAQTSGKPFPGSNPPTAQRPGELVVRYRANAHASDRAAVRGRVGGRLLRDLRFLNAEHLRIEGLSVAEAIGRLRQHPLVEYAEPNFQLHALVVPNDPLFPQMYNLENTGQTSGTPGADIHATQAWDLFTGDPELRVGVIDTGVDYTHPDLAANIWTNPGEIAGNGIDDDRNGYIDDVHGYDFANNDGDPFDDHGHGTHVSGTIAAVGDNGVGLAGVNWRARIVGIKFLDAGGSGSTAGAIAAIGYAIATGVRLTNNSWGGGGYSQGLLDAINAAGAAGQLFVAAAGNSGTDNDALPEYPASFDSPYILSVAATDHNDELATFSNFGAASVDLGAPGVSILSTLPGGAYGFLSGTSMATPHVTGAAAFVLGFFPTMPALQVKSQILSNVDPLASLAGRVASGGRLNLFQPVMEPDDVSPGAITDLATENPGSNSIGLTWTATGDDNDAGRVARYEIRYSTTPITEANFGSQPDVPGPTPLPAGSSQSTEARGLAFSTTYFFAIRAFDEVGNRGPISNLATGTTLGVPDLSVTPTSLFQELLTGARATQSITLRNEGEGTLDFSIPDPELTLGQPVQEAPTLAKGEVDPRPGLLGSGGPDGFGYRWVDSDQAGGPTFQWVDITAIGQRVPISGDDAISGPIAMGMSFPFYGNSFSTLYVSTNGFLSFSPGTGAPYVNQPLPNAGAPPNLIAPFWDDLVFPGQNAYSYFDGSRFIVSWVGVQHYGDGGPYTFQVILYPSGEIRYQFLSVATPLNSGTVGIQNAPRNIGLTTAFNVPYVHDALAVRLVHTPLWLTVTPRAGRILAGQQMPLTLSFDALGLVGDDYRALVRLLCNDPDESNVSIPVQLHVIGAPDLAVSPASLDFGSVFVGTITTRTLTVANPGTDPLVVSGIVSSHPAVTVAPSSFTVAPLAARSVGVTYAPTIPGALHDALTIASNDPDAATRQVALEGSAALPPVVSATPQSLSATVPIPGTTTQTLSLQNSGGSALTWSLQIEGVSAAAGSGLSGGPHPTEWGRDPRFGAPDGPAITVDPGPLASRPVVVHDPVGDGGPVDVETLRGSGSGGTLQAEIDLSTPLVPANFAGFLSLDVDRNRHTGLPPSFGVPGQDIGVEYEVLFFNLSLGTVQLYRRTGGFVGSFPATIGPQSLRFSIPLSYLGGDDGDMDVTGVVGTLAAPTDWFPDQGHGTILSVGWLTATPVGGVIAPGTSAAVAVTYDTEGLIGGQYLANLALATNDPGATGIDIPVQLAAVGVPDIAASPSSLDFGGLFVGMSRDLTIRLANEGSERLQIASATLSGSHLTLLGGSFPIALAPNDSTLVTVRFAPTDPCDPCIGQLSFQSDDPDENPLIVPITAVGQTPPEIAVSPASLEASLPTGQTTRRTLRIDNQGGSPLAWSLSSRALSRSVGRLSPSTWQMLGPAPSGTGVNRVGDAPTVQAVRATYGAADLGPRILLYSDELTAGAGAHTSDRALQSLGLPYTAYYYDPDGFGNALVSQSWDLVIVAHAGYFELGNWWNEMESFLGRGGRLLISTFDVDGSNSEPTTLWNTIGLAPQGDLLGSIPVYWWDPVNPLFNLPEQVPPFLQMTDAYIDDGDRAQAASAAQDPAGFTPERTANQSAIVISPNRAAIVNSFIVSENQADRDADGKPDAVELLSNEIGFLHGAEWLSADPAEGTVPPGGSTEVTISFDATQLLGGDYDADLIVASDDPDERASFVSTHLHVTGTPVPPPDITMSLEPLRAAGATTLGPLALQRAKTAVMQNTGGSDLLFALGAVATDDRPAPGWLTAVPTSGTIPVGSVQALEVRFDATDLPDGDYTADVEISTNDPDEPLVVVPCRFHVGVRDATFDVDPNSLMPRANGNWVSADLELGGGLDPHAIALSTLRLQRAVPVGEGAPISYHDDDHDGYPQVRYKFDREALRPYLGVGELVPIEVTGEVEGVTWFRAFDLVRSLPPGVSDPSNGGTYAIGTQVPLTWTDPAGHPAANHDLWLSIDDGETWQLVAASIPGNSYLWTVPAPTTDRGLLELVAFDDGGAMGSWVSQRLRIVANLTAVEEPIPNEFSLRLAGSNPGRGSVGLELALPEQTPVALKVFDVRGRLVSEITRGELEPGWHRLTWNGEDSSGTPAPAGVYFAHLSAGDRSARVRLVLLR
ncbi:MAG TPA: S8 family serine peptidase [Candidatus Eisenbacteria bacterium]